MLFKHSLALLLALATLTSFGQQNVCFFSPTDTCNSVICDTYGVGPGPQPSGWAYLDYSVSAGFNLDSVNASFNRVNQDIYEVYYCGGCGSFDFTSSIHVTNGAIIEMYDVWFDLTSENIDGPGILRVLAPTVAEPVYWDSLCVATSDILTGLKEETSAPAFSVYPLPADDFLNITADEELLGSAYRILDSVGRLIASGRINSATMKVDLHDFERGVYFISVDDTGKSLKFIVK